MTPRIVRWIAWAFVVIYIILAAAGLTLQGLAHTPYAQTVLPVLIALVILVGVWIVTGALIISRHPQHPVGWLLCTGLISGAIDMFAAGYASYDTYVLPGSLPGVALALVWLKLVVLGPHGIVAFTLIILLFPDGKFPSPGWRKVAWMTVGALLLFLPLQAVEPGSVDPSFLPDRTNPLSVSASLWTVLKPLMWTAFSILVLCYGAAFISLSIRLRSSHGDVRQQIKWLLPPAGLFGIFLLLFIIGMAKADEVIVNVGIGLGQLAITGMVVAVAFAIFKYRLYDVDLILNRTLVYGALTACVIGLYVLVVGTLGTLFQTQGNLIIALLATGLVALLFQPLREWLQRGVNRLIYGERDDLIEALSDLGKSLEVALPPDQVLPALVKTIANTLKLPFVGIAIQGQPVAVFGQQSKNPVAFSLTFQGETAGELLAAPRSPDESFTPAEMRLLRNLARQAGAAVRNAQLTADLQSSRQNLVTAREEERLRLRRDLHDGLGPALASVIWQVDSARDMISNNPSEAVQLLESSIEQAQAALADIRRLVYGLRPPALDEFGLVGALEQAAQKYQQISIEITITIEAADPFASLPAAVEVAAYRIVQEALKNAIEHGKARNCLVCLALVGNPADGSLCLTIQDDGMGLPEVVTPGVGLASMRERAEELGGTFTIHPRRVGGTEIEVCLPLV
jgi:signal transduction histidine kinase